MAPNDEFLKVARAQTKKTHLRINSEHVRRYKFITSERTGDRRYAAASTNLLNKLIEPKRT